MKLRRILLVPAGVLSLAVAVFQAAIGFSPALCAYFGAPAALMANPTMLIAASLVMAVVFAVCGLYAFSGAGVIRRLPLLRLGLIAIGGVYTLNGLNAIPGLLIVAGLIHTPAPVPPQALISVLVSLGIGLAYLVGTVAGWPVLSPSPKRAAASKPAAAGS